MNLSSIDALLAEGKRSMVFPGAVLLIARGNEKLFSMAVGNYAYDPMSPVVTPSAIYDIASLYLESAGCC